MDDEKLQKDVDALWESMRELAETIERIGKTRAMSPDRAQVDWQFIGMALSKIRNRHPRRA